MLPILFPPTAAQEPAPIPAPIPAPLPLPLPEATRAALLESLAEHRRAEAAYAAVLARFGAVEPFLHIVDEERDHQEVLLTLFRAHGIEIPPHSAQTAPPSPSALPPTTLPEACGAGVASEEATIAMYDRLLAQVRRADVRAVFRRLQAVARDQHLPAFRACANP